MLLIVKFLLFLNKTDWPVFLLKKLVLELVLHSYSTVDIVGQMIDDTIDMYVISIEFAHHNRAFERGNKQCCQCVRIHLGTNFLPFDAFHHDTMNGRAPTIHRITRPFS